MTLNRFWFKVIIKPSAYTVIDVRGRIELKHGTSKVARGSSKNSRGGDNRVACIKKQGRLRGFGGGRP